VKEFLPYMSECNHGHIVSINSMLGLMGLGGASDYCASKFGVHGFHESLRMELARDDLDGVKVTTIHPYLIDTDMFGGVQSRYRSLFTSIVLFSHVTLKYEIAHNLLLTLVFHTCSCSFYYS